MSQPLPSIGPPSLWPIGHVPSIRRDLLGFFTRCSREHGDVATIWFGPRKVYLLSHPAHIEQVLVTRNRAFQKHYALKFLRPLLGRGLLTSERDHWLRQRRLIQPAFDRIVLTGYGQAMVELTEQMLDGWSDGEPRDIFRDMTDLTLRIAAKTMMDIDIGPQLEQVAAATEVVMHDFRRRFQSAVTLPLWMPTLGNRRMKQAMKNLDEVIRGIIAEHRQSQGEHGDLLAMLMQARDADDGRGMTDQQLRDEVMTLLLAGHETTANTLSWTWYLLAQHPRAEATLRAELHEVLDGRSPTMADLPKLTFTEQIIKEAMRLYAPAYALGREACEDTTVGEYDVPRGTTLFMSQWVTHRDERWFDEPQKFKPARWTAEFERDRPRYAYFPFGGGPRACIGSTFAMMESVLLVAAIAQRVQDRPAIGRPRRPLGRRHPPPHRRHPGHCRKAADRNSVRALVLQRVQPDIPKKHLIPFALEADFSGGGGDTYGLVHRVAVDLDGDFVAIADGLDFRPLVDRAGAVVFAAGVDQFLKADLVIVPPELTAGILRQFTALDIPAGTLVFADADIGRKRGIECFAVLALAADENEVPLAALGELAFDTGNPTSARCPIGSVPVQEQARIANVFRRLA